MHRSSESIAAIASALAKAQTVLVNPEKTMTATIRGDRRGQGAERSFRYAPLSTGLDLVRKALGQHELAVIQITAIDEATRTVRLNTLLAHSSGEWIASDWPVCAISDMNMPQRMGAALTYARRYALFSLVGIAGEDDLDAPDLNETGGEGVAQGSAATNAPSGTSTVAPAENGRAAPNAARGKSLPPQQPLLAAHDSAKLREGIVAEIASLASSSAAATWASTVLGVKNTLIAEDARVVETAFETKLASLAADVTDSAPPTRLLAGLNNALNDAGSSERAGSEKARALPITKTVRHRNKEHLGFVRLQPCLICAKQPTDPHHISFAQPRALGRKVSDEFTVPLCRGHHREVHRAAKEIAWWQSCGIAPLAVAETLWQKSQSGQALNEPLLP